MSNIKSSLNLTLHWNGGSLSELELPVDTVCIVNPERVLRLLLGNITFYSKNDDTDEEEEDDEVGPVPDLLVATRHRKLRRTDTSVCMVVTPDHCLTPSKKKIIEEEGITQNKVAASLRFY